MYEIAIELTASALINVAIRDRIATDHHSAQVIKIRGQLTLNYIFKSLLFSIVVRLFLGIGVIAYSVIFHVHIITKRQ